MSSPKIPPLKCRIIQTVVDSEGNSGQNKAEFVGKNRALKAMKARGFPGHIVMELSRTGFIQYDHDGSRVTLRLECDKE